MKKGETRVSGTATELSLPLLKTTPNGIPERSVKLTAVPRRSIAEAGTSNACRAKAAAISAAAVHRSVRTPWLTKNASRRSSAFPPPR